MKTSPITLYFMCDNEDCPDHTKYEWPPSILTTSGTPTCAICGEDAEYVGWDEASR